MKLDWISERESTFKTRLTKRTQRSNGAKNQSEGD
jgi:hypothetical protein